MNLGGVKIIIQMTETYEKHGDSQTRLYRRWASMKDRCNRKRSWDAKYYHDKGIKYCDEWKGFKAFKNWALLNGYKEGLSLDRIDPDKGYYPDNCRWIPLLHQARNIKIKSHNTSGYNGVSWLNRERKFLSSIYINSKRHYIGYFDSAEEASKARDKFIVDNNVEHAYLRWNKSK